MFQLDFLEFQFLSFNSTSYVSVSVSSHEDLGIDHLFFEGLMFVI